MSNEVDQRIVEMKFNNRNFEKNVSTSMDTLKRFKESLKFDGATKGLDELNKEAKRFSLDPLSKAVDTVEMKFSAMSVAAISAISRIVTRATDAGIDLVKSLSIDNIAAGWQKFADKTTSVGTLVAQGYDMSTVENQLKRLNWFTDETSYNFTDMVANIAKFTATGKGLEESVTALEGIANWAALSGQNAATASRAMYQISQAMGAGVMRKEDWKSIQNVSMDTEEFREHALEAGVALGTLKKNIDGTFQSLTNKNAKKFEKSQFSEHLTQDAWFTSEVMMKVFQDYSAAVDKIYAYTEAHKDEGMTASEAIDELSDSLDAFAVKAFRAAQEARTWDDVVGSIKDAVSTGWMNTFELIFGSYDEAKTLFTDLANSLYDVFAEGGNQRNQVLGEALLTGWKQLLQKGIPDAEAFKDCVLQVAEATGSLDEAKVAEIRDDFEGSLKTGWLTDGILHDSLWEITKDIRTLSDEQLKEKGYSGVQIESLKLLNQSLLDGSLNVKDFADQMARVSGRENLVQAFWNIYDALFGIDEETEKATGIISAFKEAVSEIFPPFTADQVYAITERIRDFAASLKPSAETIEKFKSVVRGAASIVDLFKQAVSAIWRTLKPVFDLIGIGSGHIFDFAANLGDTITEFAAAAKKGDLFYNTIQNVIQSVKNAIQPVKNFVTSILEFLKIKLKDENGIFSGLTDGIKNASGVFAGFKAAGETFIGALKNIRNKVAEHMGGIKLDLSKPLDILRTLWDIASALLNGLFDVVGRVLGLVRDLFSSLNPVGFKDLINTILMTLATINIKWLTDGVTAFTDVLWQIQNNIKSDTIMKIAKAVGILALSIIALSLVDNEKLASSILALVSLQEMLISGVSQLSRVFSSSGGLFKSLGNMMNMKAATRGLEAMAAAFLVASIAFKIISTVDWEGVLKGIAAFGSVMITFTVVCKTLSKVQGDLKAAGKTLGSLSTVAVAMLLMSFVFSRFENMSWEGIAKGFVGIVGVLTVFTAVCSILANLKGYVTKATSILKLMIPFGVAMLLVAAALHSISKLSWEELARGLTGILGVMAIMTAVAMVISKSSGNMSTAATGLRAMLPMALAMVVVGAALKIVATMSWEDIAKGVVTFGLVMAEIVAALKILSGGESKGAGKLMATAAAILVVAAALTALSVALKIVSTIPIPAMVASVLALGVALAVVVAAANAASMVVGPLLALGAAVALIGAGMLAAGAGISIFAAGMAALIAIGPAALQLFSDALFALVTNAVTLAPTIGEAFAAAFASFITVLTGMIPTLMEFVSTLVEALYQLSLKEIPKLVNVVAILLGQVLDLLVSSSGQILKAVTDILTNVLDGIVQFVPQLVRAGTDIIVGFLHGIRDMLPEVITAAVEIVLALLEGIGNAELQFVRAAYDLAINFINQLADTIEEKAPELTAAVIHLIEVIVDSVRNSHEQWRAAAKHMIDGLIQGIKDKVSSAVQAISEFGNTIITTFKQLFQIQSPSKVMRDEVGRYIVMGIAEGITKDTSAEEAAEKKAQNIISAFKSIFDFNDTELKSNQLDYELLIAENPFWSKEEKIGAQLEKLAKDVKTGRTRLETEMAQFQAISQEFDESTIEYKNAENNLSQAWIDYHKHLQDYANAQAASIEPKVVFKETGQTLIQGFLYGITSDMTMEEAIAQKAENVIAAFENTFKSHDFNTTLRNMQADMWELTNPEPTTKADKSKYDADKKVAEVIKNKEAIEQAADQVKRTAAEYEAIVQIVGEDSDKAREVYLELAEQQRTLMELAAQRRSYETDTANGYAVALAKVNEMTEEEIDHWFDIAENNPVKLIYDAALNTAKDYSNITFDYEDFFAPLTDNEALGSIGKEIVVEFSDSIKENAPAAFDGAYSTWGPEAKDLGAQTGKDGALAFVENFDDTILKNLSSTDSSAMAKFYSERGREMLGAAFNSGDIDEYVYVQMSDYLTTLSNKWPDESKDLGEKSGAAYTEGYLIGVTSDDLKLIEAGADLGKNVNSGYCGETKTNSPSKVAEEYGEFWVIGLANGLLKMLYLVKNAGQQIGEEATESVETVVAKIDQILQGDLEFTPTISPVLDLSGIYESASGLGDVLNVEGSYSLASDAFKEVEAARMSREQSMTQWLVDSIGQQIAGLNASLDDMREVVESHGKNDLIVNIDVDGNEFARATVPDYLLASRAAGTPFYEPASTFK